MLPLESLADFQKKFLSWMCGANASETEVLRDRLLANPDQFSDSFQKLLLNTCLIDSATAIPHALAIIFFPLVLLGIRCCANLKGVNKTRYLLKYPGHDRRWVCTFILIVTLIGSVLEGMITEVTFHHHPAKPIQPHLYLPDACAVLATILSILYNHQMEVWQRPRMAWLLVLYWLVTVAANALYLLHLAYLQLASLTIIAFDFTVITTALHVFLFLNEVNVIRLKILFCKSPSASPKAQEKDAHLPCSALPSDLVDPEMHFLDEHCSTLSRITFSWLGELLKKGFQRPLEMEDLGSLPEIHGARFNHERFTKVLEKERTKAAYTGRVLQLWRVCMHAYWRDIVTTGGIRLVAELARFINPLCISGIVLFITENETKKRQMEEPHFLTVQEYFSNGFVLIGLMFIGTIIRSLCMATYWQWTVLLSQHAYSAVQTVVYEKSLRLRTSSNGAGSVNVGRITNHVSVDASNIYYFFMSMHQAWIMPTLGILTMILLFMEIGASALLCAVLLAVTLFVHLRIACLTAQIQKRVMLFSDERLKKCNEMFQGIKLLKLYGWEKLHCRSVNKVRTRELWEILKINILLATSDLLTYILPLFVTLTAFGSYTILSGEPLTPDVTFASFTLFNIAMTVISNFPLALASYVNALISSRRLQDFLSTPEVEKRCQDGSDDDARAPLSPVYEESNTFEDVITKRSRRFLTRKRRESDSGELLPATPPPLLKDNTPSSSPSSTSPSEDSDNRRNNLDGLPSNVAVKIDSGSFSWDFDSNVPVISDINVEIPAGKLTVIIGPLGGGKSSLGQAILGEMRTLSGSVKFRKRRNTIAFAAQRPWLINGSLRDNILFGQPYHAKRYQKVIKACALQADIEILPAGDLTEIGEKGLNLSGGQKQRVSIARAIYSERSIAVMDDVLSALDMRISAQVFEEGIVRMMRRSRQTVILITHHLQCLQKADHIIVMKDGKISRQGSRQEIARLDPELYCRWKRAVHLVSESETESEVESETMREERQNLLKQVSMQMMEGEDRRKPGAKDGSLTQAEDREIGPVSYKVYLYYLRAMGLRAMALIVATYLMRESLKMSGNFWLSSWSMAGLQAKETGLEAESVTLPYLLGYTVIVIGCILAASVANASLVYAIVVAAKHLHAGMLNNITKAPMRFFDTTPVGRILNRFSCDTAVIDRDVIETADNVLFYLLSCIAAFLINIIVMPLFAVAFLPVLLGYLGLQKYFIASARELKRLQNISKSPIVAHFTESFDGLSTIRAYRAEKRFLDIVQQRVTINATAFTYLWCTYRWVRVRMDMLGSLLVLFVSVGTMCGAIYSNLDASLAALAITYILRVSSQVNWLVRYTTDCEIQMNSVERVKHYSSLANELYDGTNPPADWPDQGRVTFSNVSLRYAKELQAVVEGVNVELRPGEKVALCGQTGSGKTSLALSLFRILDICQGQIFIDGVDITTVPVEVLRRALSIIPQDPELFTGTIRRNLDPERQCTDIELWDSLEIAQLKQVVSSLPKGLDSEVVGGGENFSGGERQLFCLARAFLRKSRILVMDEATASMDIDTHRISTIMNFDTVLVLSNGKIVENDSPMNLIGKEDSVFASLARGNE
ncbi:ATP-binding cassette sub-family C member 8-like isoform X2 [Acanthaster planci]|uniref:ATP-binding cassette sub-family C member 8-like isoform X2 n=1 Tax=Acanthaster planci TaxID=133434 RepID=A0A8B7XJR6_ACAPL|nr:ATP-binding cassette sub-family C member 8-like isoform X2 [Acanthaster planci]